MAPPGQEPPAHIAHPANTHPPSTGSWSGTRRSFPKRTARLIKRRDGECQLRHPGCTGEPDEADHIVGVADALAAGWDPEEIDDPSNGQAACTQCHRIKTRAEQQRGQQRTTTKRTRTRPKPQHPGLIN